MRALLVVAAVMLLGACEKPSEKALRELEMVERTADRGAICEAKKKVAEAFLKEENDRAYQLYKSAADSNCMLLQLDRQNGVAR